MSYNLFSNDLDSLDPLKKNSFDEIKNTWFSYGSTSICIPFSFSSQESLDPDFSPYILDWIILYGKSRINHFDDNVYIYYVIIIVENNQTKIKIEENYTKYLGCIIEDQTQLAILNSITNGILISISEDPKRMLRRHYKSLFFNRIYLLKHERSTRYVYGAWMVRFAGYYHPIPLSVIIRQALYPKKNSPHCNCGSKLVISGIFESNVTYFCIQCGLSNCIITNNPFKEYAILSEYLATDHEKIKYENIKMLYKEINNDE